MEGFQRKSKKLQKKKSKNKLGFSWAGGLKDLKNKYTSVELQHEMLNLWSKKQTKI